MSPSFSKKGNNTLPTTSDELLKRMCNYCAFQERSEAQTKMKLIACGASPSQIIKTIKYLKENDYLNNERFTLSFINGKINNNGWGKIKISIHLKETHHIPENLIQESLNKIDNNNYIETLSHIIEQKKKTLKQFEDDNIIKQKVINHCLSKGFTFDEIYTVLNNS